MRKSMLKLVVVALLVSPMLSSCNTKKLEEENAGLKQQVESLTAEKSVADTRISELTARVEELTKANEELAKLAKAKAKKAGK